MKLIIDYRNEENGKFVRKTVDDFEFCVRDGVAYFSADGEKHSIPLEDISQMYVR